VFDGDGEPCKSILSKVYNDFWQPQKDNHVKSGNQATDQPSRFTRSLYQDIRVFSNLSFSHTITSASSTQLASGAIVDSYLDIGIGRVMKGYPRRFQSLLLLVEATRAANLDIAFPQLVVYLASLHQSRVSQNRSDSTVYGVASDGYLFIFVTIAHDGTLERSKQFDITAGDTETVLGCLIYLLETSAANTMPEKDEDAYCWDTDTGEDLVFDLDDNDFTRSPQDDEDDE
jgi:hypothetical protein